MLLSYVLGEEIAPITPQDPPLATSNSELGKYTIVIVVIYSNLNTQLKRTTAIQLQLPC